ncbi:MAG: alpha/beta hydrolase [Proteobacteria bacterium]|nr:alpha/beta hydrolase [Pseudomonadota bacterium]
MSLERAPAPRPSAPAPAARRAATLVVAALALAALAGCASTSPRPGLRLGPRPTKPYVDCRGAPGAGPTVVLEAGSFGTSADWSPVMRDLAKTGRVCAYDRLGLAASPNRTDEPTPENIAKGMDGVLDQIGETKPVILVGHSNGAFYVETYAAMHPDRVAGLAYIDGVGVDDVDHPLLLGKLQDEETEARIAAVGGALGLVRFVASPLIDAMGLTGTAAARKWRALNSRRHLNHSRDEVFEIVPGLRRIRQQGASVPASIPVVAVVASPNPENASEQTWRQAEFAPAQRSCQGWAMEAPRATHLSILGRDRAYVISAVKWLQTPGLRQATVCTDKSFKG